MEKAAITVDLDDTTDGGADGPEPRSIPARLVAVVAALLLAGGCTGGSDDRPVVLAASSLVEVTAELVADWGGDALVSEAGSQVLAAQLRGGADADLLLLADPTVAEALAREGLASRPQPVATNRLAVVVSAGAAGRVTGPADLAAPDLQVVVADAAVPLGAYTRQGLDRLEETGLAPPGTGAAVLDNAVSFEDAARSVLAKVTSGEADAAIVYRTDALAAGDEVTVLSWPDAADVEATYTLQTVPAARAAGTDLAAFLASREAAPVWRRHGFRPR